MEFIKNFQSEAPLKRGSVSAQDASLHERVMAQVTQFKPFFFFSLAILLLWYKYLKSSQSLCLKYKF